MNSPSRGAIGIDIVEIKRLEAACRKWGEPFLNRIFTPRERDYSSKKKFPYQHLAARFAAKEAIFKALGEMDEAFVGWKNIEILNDPNGKPSVHWHGEADKARRRHKIQGAAVSLSHSDHYAVASAMLVFRQK